MLGITHKEVRRHPRWREELNTPPQIPRYQRITGSRALGMVAFLIVAVAIAVLFLKG
jgi:hypothetical protein